MENIISLGKRIYNVNNSREFHRMWVFVIRAKIHSSKMRKLFEFFQQTDERKKLIRANPFPFEQVTRAFFYNKSKFDERSNIIMDHFIYLENKLADGWMEKISIPDNHYVIWRADKQDVNWYATVVFNGGQRKEGLLSITMFYNNYPLYQTVFWLARDRNEEYSLWIGAMQGPSGGNAKELVKETTKRSYRYRTKNLILYMTMAVARVLAVKHIYAVSNEGYYAMNHVRRDRKLKTNFGEFWEEVGGHKTADYRFYELPMNESRKTMEEVPTRKRAMYRKRFAFQDDVEAQIVTNLQKIMR